jgi:hypothetical protein
VAVLENFVILSLSSPLICICDQPHSVINCTVHVCCFVQSLEETTVSAQATTEFFLRGTLILEALGLSTADTLAVNPVGIMVLGTSRLQRVKTGHHQSSSHKH